MHAWGPVLIMSTLCCIWRQLPVVGVVPPNLCDHSMVYYGGRLFVFGGNPKWGESTTNETYACDLRTHHWAFVETEENPAARCAHTAHVHGKRMYIFGGCSADRSEFYTNIAYLDLGMYQWWNLEYSLTWKNHFGGLSLRPKPFRGHIMTAV